MTYAVDVNLIGDNIRRIWRHADVLLNVCKDMGLARNIRKANYVKVGFHGTWGHMSISGSVEIHMKSENL